MPLSVTKQYANGVKISMEHQKSIILLKQLTTNGQDLTI
jgi:hypothetical protein